MYGETPDLHAALARIKANEDAPCDGDLHDVERFVRRAIPALNDWLDTRFVELAYCIGAECIKLHGMRLATWRGTGPCSIYILCDECHSTRLDDDERKHMVEIEGASAVRRLHLHDLSGGRSVSREGAK